MVPASISALAGRKAGKAIAAQPRERKANRSIVDIRDRWAVRQKRVLAVHEGRPGLRAFARSRSSRVLPVLWPLISAKMECFPWKCQSDKDAKVLKCWHLEMPVTA